MKCKLRSYKELDDIEVLVLRDYDNKRLYWVLCNSLFQSVLSHMVHILSRIAILLMRPTLCRQVLAIKDKVMNE